MDNDHALGVFKLDGREFPILGTVDHGDVIEYVLGPASRPMRGPDDVLSIYIVDDPDELADVSIYVSFEDACHAAYEPVD